MVTSGIYLIVRSNVLFEIVRESGTLVLGIVSSPDLVAYVGAATAVLAGLIAFTQFDIKKVLAYSTVSQLGFMVAAIGMGAYVAEHVPSCNPCFLQSVALPWLWFRHSWHGAWTS